MDTEENKNDFNIQTIINEKLHTPGFCFSREEFLRAEFQRFYSQDIIDKIVMSNPADVGVPPEVIEEIIKPLLSQRIACNCFSEFKYIFEYMSYRPNMTYCPTCIFSIIPRLPIWRKEEMLEFCNELLYAIQILIYIYGLPQINMKSRYDQFNDDILKLFMISIGTMLGSIEAKEKFISILTILRENDTKIQIITEAIRNEISHSLFRKIIKKTEKILKDKFTSVVDPRKISCILDCRDINNCLKLELYYPKYVQTLRENRSIV